MLNSIIGTIHSGESIDFSHESKLAKELLIEFDKIGSEMVLLGQNATVKETTDVFAKSDIAKITKKYTGLNIILTGADFFTAYVINPDLDSSMGLMEHRYDKFRISETMKEVEINRELNIHVDLKRGFVTGAEKIKSQIAIGIGMFHTQDHEELTAIYMHEVGHLIAYYYGLTVSATTNFLLKEFTDRLFDIKTTEARVKLINAVDKKVVKLPDLKALSEADDKNVIRVIVIDGMQRQNRSAFGSKFYDRRAFEAMADNFVVKHGMFLPLSRGLDKLTVAPYSLIAQLLFNAIEVPYFFLTFLLSIFDDGDEYDSPIKRIEVIRKQAISSLKDVSPEHRKTIIEQIDSVSEIVSDTREYRSIGRGLAQFFIPSVRSKYNNKRTQEALEHLSISEMNLLTSKLDQI